MKRACAQFIPKTLCELQYGIAGVISTVFKHLPSSIPYRKFLLHREVSVSKDVLLR
jgi:hypothetical protein